MTTLLLLLLALAAVLVDLSVAPGATLFGVRPQFTLVLITLWAALRPDLEVMLLAPAAGLLLGLLGNELLGASVLALAPVVVVSMSIHTRITERRLPLTLSVVAAGTVAFAVTHAIIGRFGGASVLPALSWLGAVLALALLNTGLAAALYWPLSRLPVASATRNVLRRY